jgi:hypothetical protein
MANTSKIKGFTVVGNLVGGAATGQARLYYVAAASDEILVGDIVKLSGSGSAGGIPGAELAATGDVPCGVVVGIVNAKQDQDGLMTTGSLTLDVPAINQIAAGAAGYLLVNDDPNVIMEVEAGNGTPAVTDIGLNASHSVQARTAATRTSPAYLDFGTEAVSAALNFNILGFVRRADNEVGASAKMLVRFNVHQYKSVGNTGL